MYKKENETAHNAWILNWHEYEHEHEHDDQKPIPQQLYLLFNLEY